MRDFPRLRASLPRPNWTWTVRRATALPLAASIASLFLGVGLNAMGVVITGGLSASQARSTKWLMWTTLAAAAIGYVAVAAARRGRGRMLRRNGTAFIVKERADDWESDEPDGFYAQVRRRFARAVEVPGPGLLSPPWGWPLDARARHWEGKLTELARSFRALYLAETGGTDAESVGATGVFVTASWAVALALGYRLKAGDRRIVLDVWQRPSNARAGKVEPAIWAQRGHRFGEGGAVAVPAGVARTERVWDAVLTVDRSGMAPGMPVPADGPVSLLLIRFGRARWSTLPDAGTESADLEPLPVTLHDMAGVVPTNGTVPVRLHELRCTPPGGRFAWEDFPFLVDTAVSWIERKAKQLTGHTLMLCTSMPNETALGIGLSAGQPSRLGWPEHLWPVIHRKPTNTLVVPHLDLGRAGATRVPE